MIFMRLRRASSLVAALALLAPAALVPVSAAAARAQVRAFDLDSTGSTVRFVVDLDGASPWHFFMLDNPRRAVLDLRATRLPHSVALPGPTGVVRALRSGPQAGGTLRLVLELPDGMRARALAPGGGRGAAAARVVIELGSASPGPGAAVALAAAQAMPGTAAVAAPAELVAPERSQARDERSATRAPALRAPHAPMASGREIVVAVDAGHGGPDPGATGPGGTREKDVVLGIARDLAARIDREPGMRAVLTRDRDHFLTLRERIARARAAKADMFVSVHADSIRDTAVSGSSVYVLSMKGASDEQSRWLAERENSADLMGGVSLEGKDPALASVLLDLSQSASISASMQAAERVLRSLQHVGEVRKPRVQQAGFVVLKSPDIPSMLVETAYISNPAEERRLRRDEHRGRVADAIFDGVQGYFREHPPEGTRFALERRNALPSTAQVLSRN
jgi:N-acetylmuramoyl-L-alanine amidase